ncbi:hypothetical protein ACU6U9_20365 [Pseudomonas sp. HK3]
MNIDTSLIRLGFTEEWIEFGIITEGYVLELNEEITTSEDKNAEHYRGWAFSEYLKSKSSLSDREVCNIFKIQDNGPDKCDLHGDRIYSLLHSNLLTDLQLEELEVYPEVLQPPLQKLYFRKRIIRKVDANGVDACFSDITNANDPDVNEYVIRCEDINLKHINWFKENGGNKRIRNIAKQLASSRKYIGGA